MKTSELTKAALDWAVAKCEGFERTENWAPKFSTDWAQGGPIIEREKIEVFIEDGQWMAYSSFAPPQNYEGDTPLIAAMRCYVASKLGDEVDLPEELS